VAVANNRLFRLLPGDREGTEIEDKNSVLTTFRARVPSDGGIDPREDEKGVGGEEGGGQQEACAAKGTSGARADATVVVEVQDSAGRWERVRVSRRSVQRLNGPQQPPCACRSAGEGKGEDEGEGEDEGDRFCLEDGLRADFSTPLARLKMCQAALALAPLAAELDFAAGGRCVAAQRGMVRAVRRCLDLTTFQTAGEGGKVGRARDHAR
jgi:hypothetical protein